MNLKRGQETKAVMRSGRVASWLRLIPALASKVGAMSTEKAEMPTLHFQWGESSKQWDLTWVSDNGIKKV